MSIKNLALFFIAFIPRLLWCQQSEPARISERFVQVPLISALDQLENQYHIMFYYKEEWFRNDTLNVVIANSTVEESVRIILTSKPYIYRIINDSNVIFLPREKATAFLKQMTDYSIQASLDRNVILIGDIENSGKSCLARITPYYTWRCCCNLYSMLLLPYRHWPI